ncbi:MAG TPA: MlaD family protein [Lacunisphaera sp.]|jgi:phospholipid/cholesterol/gamma-HCH transport system substrate-binding protein
MNNSQQAIRVGLFFVLGLALAWITFESLNGGRLFKQRGYTIVAGFDNLKGLKVGDDVLMAGVKIGSVGNTRLGDRRVEAVLRILPTIKIPNDAVASVEVSSLLGANYLGVSFGTPTAAPLNDGDEIKAKNTIDMNEVISKLGNLGTKLEEVMGDISKTMGGDGKNGNLFQKIDKLVSDNGPKLTETVSNLQEITAKIKSGDGTLGRLINDPKLHDDLIASINEIKLAATDARNFMNDTKGIVADVKTGKGALGLLLYDEGTANSIKVTANNLRQISDKLNGGEGTLGKLISDDKIYRDVQGLMKKADRAIDGLGDSGPITAVGVVANSLF